MTLTNNQLKLHRRLAGRQRGAGGGRGGEGGWVDWGWWGWGRGLGRSSRGDGSGRARARRRRRFERMEAKAGSNREKIFGQIRDRWRFKD